MESTVVISSDKQLLRNFGFLSKCLTEFLVQRMSNCLYRSGTITAHEVQVIKSQATDMQKSSRLIQIVIKKGHNACSMFLRCLGMCDPAMYENVTGCKAQFSPKDHEHSDDISHSENMQFQPYIINIQNSSLTNCIIGKNNSQYVTIDQNCLLSQDDAINEDSQRHDQPIPDQDKISGSSICMEKSNIKYAIIGDHNSMTVTECLDSDTEEDTEPEPDVVD